MSDTERYAVIVIRAGRVDRIIGRNYVLKMALTVIRGIRSETAGVLAIIPQRDAEEITG